MKSKHLDQAPVALHISEVRRILGNQITTEQILHILAKLGFAYTPEQGDDEFTVQIPSWRLDVEREIDLIEEIARIHGYDKFANTLPAFSGMVVELPEAKKDARVRSSLLALGYDEAVSLTFISHEDAQRFSSVPVLELANPQSEEASVMRTSLVPGMLNMLAYNLNRGSGSVRLFEAGNVFEALGADRREKKTACLGATIESLKKYVPQGATLDVSKGEGAVTLEVFRSFKGDIENLLGAFEHKSLSYDAQVAAYYHPGRSARAVMDGAPVAQLGQLHPDVAAARKLRQDVFIAEIYLDQLYRHDLRRVRYEALPRYPAVERDFSFIFSDAVTFEKIETAVHDLALAELRSFAPAEIFRGGNVSAGKYSILLRAVFQSGDRTLSDAEVAKWADAVVSTLKKLGGEQRA